jgi:hypothetical protein
LDHAKSPNLDLIPRRNLPALDHHGINPAVAVTRCAQQRLGHFEVADARVGIDVIRAHDTL